MGLYEYCLQGLKHTHIISVREQEALGGKTKSFFTREGFTFFCKFVSGHEQRTVLPPIRPEERHLFCK